MSQELKWGKSFLAGFLSRASVLRDEDAPFFLVFRLHLFGSSSEQSQQISRNVCVSVHQLGLLVG